MYSVCAQCLCVSRDNCVRCSVGLDQAQTLRIVSVKVSFATVTVAVKKQLLSIVACFKFFLVFLHAHHTTHTTCLPSHVPLRAQEQLLVMMLYCALM